MALRSSFGQQLLANEEILLRICRNFDASSGHEAQPPTTREWSTLCILARTCKAFWKPSTAVLWQDEDICRLFTSLLPATRDHAHKVVIPVTYPVDLRQNDWDRFKIYAGKVKTLALKQKTLPMEPLQWSLLQTSLQPLTIEQLFVNVRRLYLYSDDTVPMSFARRLLPQLDFLNIKFNTNDDPGTRIVLTQLQYSSASLSNLRLHDACLRPRHLWPISAIISLTRLAIQLDKTTAPHELKCLRKLKNLRCLEISQAKLDRPMPFPFKTGQNATEALNRTSKLELLEELYVRGSMYLLAGVVATIAPGPSVVTLGLNIKDANDEVALFPLVAAVYAQRCSGLVVFRATSKDPHLQMPRAAYRDDPRFQLKPMLEALANLTELRTLHIDGVPFLEPGINVLLLKIVRGLSDLEDLLLLPIPLVTLSADTFVVPDMKRLKKLLKANEKLERLEIYLDVTRFKTLSGDFLSDHGMKSLKVSSCGTPPLDQAVQVETARYITRLMPNLTALAASIGSEPAFVDSWAAVWKLVENNYMVRLEQQYELDTQKRKRRRGAEKARLATQAREIAEAEAAAAEEERLRAEKQERKERKREKKRKKREQESLLKGENE